MFLNLFRWLFHTFAKPGPVMEYWNEFQSSFPGCQSEWDRCVYRVIHGEFEVGGAEMWDHVFLGYLLPVHEQANHPFKVVGMFDSPARIPALVPWSVLDGHVSITGPAGSGKTTIGQIGILTQLIRRRSRVGTSPIIVIDLKGDPALFNKTRDECRKRGQTFRYFTLEQGKETAHFSVLQELCEGNYSILEYCERMINACDLWHGFFYGAGYFSEQCRNLLLKTLKSMKPLPQSWEDLYACLLDTLDRREHRDAFELIGRIFALAQIPALGPAPQGVDSIQMRRAFAYGECVYFWLPALASSMSVVAVAKMALFCFIDAAREWNTAGCTIKRGYCFMDEAQVACGQNMERVFQQATGAKVSLIFSNQSLGNLDSRDAPQLSRTIWVNTRLKISYGILDDRERQDWIALAGETIGTLRSYTQTDKGMQVTEHETVHKRLSPNVFNAINNEPGGALLYVNGDSGLVQYGSVPHEIRCPYPMTLDEYKRFESTAWPDMTTTMKSVDDVQLRKITNDVNFNTQVESNLQNWSALEELFNELVDQKPKKPRTGRRGR